MGPIDADIMFIGEAPGRHGADASEIPFHGDKAGDNFEELLKSSGLSRRDIFVTNAVLCNPKDEFRNNATPQRSEITNCSSYLRQQIDLVDPLIVVTLGGLALKAVNLIEEHNLVLADVVRSTIRWYGRKLLPLYHPGQRAMIHRSFSTQAEDYRFAYAELKAATGSTTSPVVRPHVAVAVVARAIVQCLPGISYFALHKLFYLFELDQVRRHGYQLTDAFFVRQKDGPYCVDLHPNKLKRALLSIVGNATDLRVIPSTQDDLFGRVKVTIAESVKTEIEEFMRKHHALDNNRLKTKAYLSQPMRQILREEQKLKTKLYNAPIYFELPKPRSARPHRLSPRS